MLLSLDGIQAKCFENVAQKGTKSVAFGTLARYTDRGAAA
jgi:hypothetical protein